MDLYFSNSQYINIYLNEIEPLNDADMWSDVDGLIILHSEHKRMLIRPKRNIKGDKDEDPRSARNSMIIYCQHSLLPSHSKRACPHGDNPSTDRPPKVLIFYTIYFYITSKII